MTTATLASGATLDSVGSHSVSLDYRGGSVTREECFPRLTAMIRGGHAVKVGMHASRYVTSDDRWTQWNIYVKETEGEGIGDKTRDALRAECVPIVEAWLDSDEYRLSRQRAYAYMLGYAIREERYSAQAVGEMLARCWDELDPLDRSRLDRAKDRLGEMLALLDEQPASAQRERLGKAPAYCGGIKPS